MKALLLTLSTVSLVSTSLATAGPASAQAGDPTPDIVDFCEALVEIRPETNVGLCLSSLIAAGPALDTHVCLFWKRNDLLEQFGFRNVGECVKSGIAEP